VYCNSDGVCVNVEKVAFDKPLSPDDLKLQLDGVIAVCVKTELVNDWRRLAQAMYYAYFHRGPAKNPNISALMFFTTSSSIRDAVSKASPIGEKTAVCALLGTRERVEKALANMPRGEPHYPRGLWNPWDITKYAIEMAKWIS